MDIPSAFEKAANATAAVASGIQPEQFLSPTPCSEWNVEQLMNHLIGSLEYFTARAEGREVGRPQPASPAGYEQTVTNLRNAALGTATAWARPGVLEETITSPAGAMPAAMLANIALSEMLAHTWDLARATGQRVSLDDSDVEAVLAGMRQTLKPDARQPAFGPEVEPAEEASAIDRLAAFLGRPLS